MKDNSQLGKSLYKLSPSDFRYLWEDCKHCYYLKIKRGIELPSIGIPGVFMKMNSLLQNSIQGLNLRDINPDLPSGVIEIKEGFLKSASVPPLNKCYISGRFDIVSRLDDGSYAVIDFKISDPNEEKVQKFTNQLHAYKFALENPTFGDKKKVSKLGIIVVSPEQIGFKNGFIFFKSTPQWFEITENMPRFFDFIGEVSTVLDGDLPQPTDSCKWCIYRTRFEPKKIIEEDGIPF